MFEEVKTLQSSKVIPNEIVIKKLWNIAKMQFKGNVEISLDDICIFSMLEAQLKSPEVRLRKISNLVQSQLIKSNTTQYCEKSNLPLVDGKVTITQPSHLEHNQLQSYFLGIKFLKQLHQLEYSGKHLFYYLDLLTNSKGVNVFNRSHFLSAITEADINLLPDPSNCIVFIEYLANKCLQKDKNLIEPPKRQQLINDILDPQSRNVYNKNSKFNSEVIMTDNKKKTVPNFTNLRQYYDKKKISNSFSKTMQHIELTGPYDRKNTMYVKREPGYSGEKSPNLRINSNIKTKFMLDELQERNRKNDTNTSLYRPKDVSYRVSSHRETSHSKHYSVNKDSEYKNRSHSPKFTIRDSPTGIRLKHIPDSPKSIRLKTIPDSLKDYYDTSNRGDKKAERQLPFRNKSNEQNKDNYGNSKSKTGGKLNSEFKAMYNSLDYSEGSANKKSTSYRTSNKINEIQNGNFTGEVNQNILYKATKERQKLNNHLINHGIIPNYNKTINKPILYEDKKFDTSENLLNNTGGKIQNYILKDKKTNQKVGFFGYKKRSIAET